MANVNVEGHGQYTVSPDKLPELIQWLSTNAAQLQEKQQQTDGNTLLNEQKPAGQNPKAADPDNQTYNFGTTWI